MATVTPNFNWPVPTSTDLVKDGATAIEALGDSIDASLVDLKGGTSGQVLSKNSNTDMDFTWVTTDDANAIQNSIVDAKGDLISATANDTPARLAVGNNGETLVADSSTSTGLRWTGTPSASNPVLNSAFQVWQRGTSFTANNIYTADRWFKPNYNNVTVSRQTTSDTSNLPFIQYCARVQRDNGTSGTSSVVFTQSFETANSIPFIGKTVTLSFYARRGANFSAASNVMVSSIYSGTGTDQNVSTSYTGLATTATSNNTLTTTWQRFSVTGTVSSSATEIALEFYNIATGTSGAADYFEITGVQLDVGSVALPFRTYAATLQGELAACQRYFQCIIPTGTFQDLIVGSSADSTSFCRYPYKFPVQMRVAPTLGTTGTASDYMNLLAAGAAAASSVPTLSYNRTDGTALFLSSSSITVGQGTTFRNSSVTPTNFLTFSAEL